MTLATDAATGRPMPGWTVLARVVVATGTGAGVLLLLAVGVRGSPTDVATLAARAAGGAVASTVILLVLLLLTRCYERRRLRDIGLGAPADAWRAFLTGAAAWLLPAALAFGALALAGQPLTVVAPGGRTWVILALLFLAVLASEAIPEELVFRGYVTAVLAERLGAWTTVVLQAALFSGVAVLLRGGVGALDLSLFVAMGVVLGHLRVVTGSVWTTIGLHTAFQTGSQLVLTHDVVELTGTEGLAMVALGPVPFTAAVVLVPLVASAKPGSATDPAHVNEL